MAIKLFGFEISRSKEEEQEQEVENKILQQNPIARDEEGGISVQGGYFQNYFVDLDTSVKTEKELINRYRSMAENAEIDTAVDEIVNEMVVIDGETKPVKINLDDLDDLKVPQKIKDTVEKEFDRVLALLDFSNMGYEICRKWYIDGRLYYDTVIDVENPQNGIKKITYIDPRKIVKVNQVEMKKDPVTGLEIPIKRNEFFVYNNKGIDNKNVTAQSDSVQGVKISKDRITYVHSGVFDKSGKYVLSHLHKAIRPLNQLKWLENAVIIYRLSRAPERRIFRVEVGNLPRHKAEQFVYQSMVRHKNKIDYNVNTGDIVDQRKFMTLNEDFWFPMRDGKGTNVDTLAGGQNLGEMDDVDFFKNKLYKSLNVPITRLESENGFTIGRSSEITRDELKFSRFISRLRLRFSHLFMELLRKQLILKNVFRSDEWEKIKEKIRFDFSHDNFFAELKNAEILRERLSNLRDITEYQGEYYSREWIKKNVLNMTDMEIDEMEKQIKKEEKVDPEPDREKFNQGGFGGFGGNDDRDDYDNDRFSPKSGDDNKKDNAPEPNKPEAKKEKEVEKKAANEERNILSFKEYFAEDFDLSDKLDDFLGEDN